MHYETARNADLHCFGQALAIQPPNLIDAMKAKIDTDQGKQIYARRLGIVELVVEPVETRSLPTSVCTSA